MRVLSCVPLQRHQTQEKWDWIDTMAKLHKPDLFVTPQEYFGGIQTLYFKEAKGIPVAFKQDDIVKPALKLAKKHKMAIAIGALIMDENVGERRERIYLIDPDNGLQGYQDKWALPAYDHINAGGLTQVSPELNMGNRSVSFELKGAKVSVFFCWEVHAPVTWFALSRANPDIVLSMIKFGVCGWPQKTNENGKSWVKGFGFGLDGGWIERLQMGSKFDVVAPVVCSTNSWNLPQRSRPLCGTIYPFDIENSLWHPPKGARGPIEEMVVVDDINPLRWRNVREHKIKYFEAVGDWPTSEARSYTMAFKTRRMERKIVPQDILNVAKKGLIV